MKLSKSNATTYTWDEINIALMNLGRSPKLILKVRSAMPGRRKIFMWIEINQALTDLRYPPKHILGVLSALKEGRK
jgi:hypothetical protein